MNKRNAFLTALILVLILSLSIGSALAYFYTSDDSESAKPMDSGTKTTITETVDSKGTKIITITNSSDSKQAVYVRAKAFGTPDPTYGTEWGAPDSNGYYYYPGILEPGQSTDPTLTVQVVFPGPATADNINQVFNVIVVYEATPVMYDSDGNPLSPTETSVWAQTASEA